LEQKDDLNKVQELMTRIKDLVQKNDFILKDFEDIWDTMEQAKRKKKEEEQVHHSTVKKAKPGSRTGAGGRGGRRKK